MVIIECLDDLYLPDNFKGIVYSNVKVFIKNKKHHRYYGPAQIWHDGYKSWWFNNGYYGNTDYKYNQKQFIKDLNKLWLL